MGCIQYAPPFSDSQYVTATRALDTVYTNTSGKFMAVYVSLEHAITVAGGTAVATGLIAGANRAVVGLNSAPVQTASFLIFLLVRPGSTYRVNTTLANGTVTLVHWVEVT